VSSLHLSKAGEPREGERKNDDDDDDDDDAQKRGTFRNQEAVELGLSFRTFGFLLFGRISSFGLKHLTDKYEMRANYDRLSMHGGLRFNA